MKALMFGWEFPPHILGGLGTASYGLTKGMSECGNMDITFVIPKPWGDEDKSFAHIIGACNTPIAWRDVSWEQVRDRLGRYMDPQEYFNLRDHIYADFNYMHLNDLGCIEFSGRYPDNLLEEINNYSIVAGVIARTYPCDVIHSHDWLTYPAGIHAKQVTGKPLVIHVHATDFDRSRGNVNPTVYAIEKDGMNQADHIITVSNLTRKTVIEKYNIDPAKVTTVHNAVEPLSEEIKAINIPRNTKEKVVTFLGRITMQKGPEYFVEAAAQVLRKNNNVRFVMAGSGDMMNKMIRLAAQRNISDHFQNSKRTKSVICCHAKMSYTKSATAIRKLRVSLWTIYDNIADSCSVFIIFPGQRNIRIQKIFIFNPLVKIHFFIELCIYHTYDRFVLWMWD